MGLAWILPFARGCARGASGHRRPPKMCTRRLWNSPAVSGRGCSSLTTCHVGVPCAGAPQAEGCVRMMRVAALGWPTGVSGHGAHAGTGLRAPARRVPLQEGPEKASNPPPSLTSVTFCTITRWHTGVFQARFRSAVAAGDIRSEVTTGVTRAAQKGAVGFRVGIQSILLI